MALVDPQAYLDGIDVPAVVRERCEVILARYGSVMGELDGEIFVSETTAEDGSRDFRSLWVLTAQWAMEADLAEQTREELDGTRYEGLVHWVLRATNYDFVSASSESRLQAELWFTGEWIGEINASGRNCDYLRDLFSRRFIHANA